MHRWFIKNAVLVLLMLSGLWLFIGIGVLAQENCTPINFSLGKSSTEISGTAPPEDVLCYSLATLNGQTASIEVAKGKNIIFSVIGLVDARGRFKFKTKKKTYEIVVGQLMRAVAGEPFRIRISVSGAKEKTRSSNRERVTQVQQLLNRLGYPAGKVDGKAGRKTRRAIRAFQRDAGIKVTGRLSDELLFALQVTQERSASPGDGRPRATRGRPAVGAKGGIPDVAAATLPDGISCADRPAVTTLATPVPVIDFSDKALVFYSNDADVIRIAATDTVQWYMAGAGDDLIFVDGPKVGTDIRGENGGDTVLICAIGDVSTFISVTPTDVPVEDAAPDLVYIDQAVFIDPPTGNPVISIFGLASQNDRVIISVPENMDVGFDENQSPGDIWLDIGTVKVKISSAKMSRPFSSSAIVIVTSGGRRVPVPDITSFGSRAIEGKQKIGSAPVTLAGNSPDVPVGNNRCPEPADIAGESLPLPRANSQEFFDRSISYGDADDVFAFVGNDWAVDVLAGGGRDTVYVYDAVSGTQVFGSFGADTIMLCRPADDGVSLTVDLGSGTGVDVDADTLIVQADMFGDIPAGFIREINVFSFLPAIDRIILRIPKGMSVTYGDPRTGAAELSVGNVEINLYRTDDYIYKPFNWDSVILVPVDYLSTQPEQQKKSTTAAVLDWKLGDPYTLSGDPVSIKTLEPSCGGMRNPVPSLALTEPLDLTSILKSKEVEFIEYGTDALFYSHNNDLIRVAQTRRPTQVSAGGGDDMIYLLDAADGLMVEGGSGSDVIVVCSMVGAELRLSIGTSYRWPDRVVIAPAVFLNIPAGIDQRLIDIGGFLSRVDQLELRIPPGIDVKRKKLGMAGWQELKIGKAIVRLRHNLMDVGMPEFDFSSVVIVPSVAR